MGPRGHNSAGRRAFSPGKVCCRQRQRAGKACTVRAGLLSHNQSARTGVGTVGFPLALEGPQASPLRLYYLLRAGLLCVPGARAPAFQRTKYTKYTVIISAAGPPRSPLGPRGLA